MLVPLEPDSTAQEMFLRVLQAAEPAMLLLSGGVDSSLLAALQPSAPAVTVGLVGESPDLLHAEKVARQLQLDWYGIALTREAALEQLDRLMRLRNSYNLELLNDIPLYVGCQFARGSGATTIRTGEFADEAFRGYSYLYAIATDEFRQRLAARAVSFSPPSLALAESCSLLGQYPYCAADIIALARMLTVEDNVAFVETDVDGDYYSTLHDPSPGRRLRPWGKMLLRRLAYGLLPPEIAWRQKQHLEFGSGTHLLEAELAGSIAPTAMARLEREGRWFLPAARRAHAALYLRYCSLGLHPPVVGRDDQPCPSCGGGIRPDWRGHCRTCGHWPAHDGRQASAT